MKVIIENKSQINNYKINDLIYSSEIYVQDSQQSLGDLARVRKIVRKDGIWGTEKLVYDNFGLIKFVHSTTHISANCANELVESYAAANRYDLSKFKKIRLNISEVKIAVI